MQKNHWQLTTPLQAIIFDCDGTLSRIEGIDELARNAGHFDSVSALTKQAMGQTGMTPEIYAQRLALTSPTQLQIKQLGKQYCAEITPDTPEVIQILQRLGKQVFIMSAGIQTAVNMLGDCLDVPRQNIFAVNLQFDDHGNYQSFDTESPLVFNNGKHVLAQKLSHDYAAIALIGDGLNDYAAHDVVTRFIGYGGMYYRKNLADLCEYYTSDPSMACVLPWCLTAAECIQLSAQEKLLYEKGWLLNERCT